MKGENEQNTQEISLARDLIEFFNREELSISQFQGLQKSQQDIFQAKYVECSSRILKLLNMGLKDPSDLGQSIAIAWFNLNMTLRNNNEKQFFQAQQQEADSFYAIQQNCKNEFYKSQKESIKKLTWQELSEQLCKVDEEDNILQARKAHISSSQLVLRNLSHPQSQQMQTMKKTLDAQSVLLDLLKQGLLDEIKIKSEKEQLQSSVAGTYLQNLIQGSRHQAHEDKAQRPHTREPVLYTVIFTGGKSRADDKQKDDKQRLER